VLLAFAAIVELFRGLLVLSGGAGRGGLHELSILLNLIVIFVHGGCGRKRGLRVLAGLGATLRLRRVAEDDLVSLFT